MDLNIERSRRIQKVLERHKNTYLIRWFRVAVKQDLQRLAEELSNLVEQPVALRQYLEKMFLSGNNSLTYSGWDNLQEQILRVSTGEQEDNKGDRDDDDISLSSSSRLSSDD